MLIVPDPTPRSPLSVLVLVAGGLAAIAYSWISERSQPLEGPAPTAPTAPTADALPERTVRTVQGSATVRGRSAPRVPRQRR